MIYSNRILGMRFDYIADEGHTLVIYRDDPLTFEDLSDLQVRMLQSNRIPHVLPFEKFEKDDEVKLLYRFFGKRKLSDVLRLQRMQTIDFYRFMHRIVLVLLQSNNYMLRYDHYILDEDFIYVDQDDDSVHLCYLPLKTLTNKCHVGEQLEKLVFGLLAHVEHIVDQHLWEFIEMVRDPHCSLLQLKEQLVQLKKVNEGIVANGVEAVINRQLAEGMASERSLNDMQATNERHAQLSDRLEGRTNGGNVTEIASGHAGDRVGDHAGDHAEDHDIDQLIAESAATKFVMNYDMSESKDRPYMAETKDGNMGGAMDGEKGGEKYSRVNEKDSVWKRNENVEAEMLGERDSKRSGGVKENNCVGRENINVEKTMCDGRTGEKASAKKVNTNGANVLSGLLRSRWFTYPTGICLLGGIVLLYLQYPSEGMLYVSLGCVGILIDLTYIWEKVKDRIGKGERFVRDDDAQQIDEHAGLQLRDLSTEQYFALLPQMTTVLSPSDRTMVLNESLQQKLMSDTEQASVVHHERQDAYLEIEVAGQTIRLTLQGNTFAIGRDNPICREVIESIGVSRLHCDLARNGAHWWIQDLASRNGTLINGTPLVPYKWHMLEDGDEITCVGNKFVYGEVS